MHSTKQLRAIEQRTLKSLDQLHGNLAGIERRCAAVKTPRTVGESLLEFKKLWPVFEEALSFLAVIETNIHALEEQRQREVEQQLISLRRYLTRLHLTTAEPLLRMVADGRDPLALGTRHVMERWIKYLDQMETQLQSAKGAAVSDSERDLLEHMRGLAHIILERAPDLLEFTDRGTPPAPEPQQHAGPRRIVAPTRDHGSAIPQIVRLTVKIHGLRVFVDPTLSAGLAVEVRRLGLTAGLAAAMGVQPSNVVMVLNGKDPFSTEHLQAATEYLRKNLGDSRFELIESAGA